MSRVSLLDRLYSNKKKGAMSFDYDRLCAPPIRAIFSESDIQELIKIATSARYSGNINKKYELIDSVMKCRGFKRAHAGTNRLVYNFLGDPSFVAKVAVDSVGMKDSPAEYMNQEWFKPFCCKIFEVDSSGVIAFVERVNPISSIEEFSSLADDIFNMMVTKIIGKYVVDDLGVEKFMNYGIRQDSHGVRFGPVIIDFPYAYELDGAKMICKRPINGIPCDGEIDYDAGLSHLICTKCGRIYQARELASNSSGVKFMYIGTDSTSVRVQVIDSDGNIISDSGRTSRNLLTLDEYKNGGKINKMEPGVYKVDKIVREKRKFKERIREEHFAKLQRERMAELINKKQKKFNPVIETETRIRAKTIKENPESHQNTGYNFTSYTDTTIKIGRIITDNDSEEAMVVDEPIIEEPEKVIAVSDTVQPVETAEVETKETESDRERKVFPELENEHKTLSFSQDVAETIMDAIYNPSTTYEDISYDDYEPEDEVGDPEEDTDDDEEYYDYSKYNDKSSRKLHQKNRNKGFNSIDDMEDF